MTYKEILCAREREDVSTNFLCLDWNELFIRLGLKSSGGPGKNICVQGSSRQRAPLLLIRSLHSQHSRQCCQRAEGHFPIGCSLWSN